MDAFQKIEKEIEEKAVSHASLVIGGSVVAGERFLAKIIHGLSCRPDDVTELSGAESSGKAGEIKVGDLRLFLHETALTPHGEVRIGVIRNAEKLNQASANALLKTLEEPPEHLILVLLAASDSVIGTIKSRCRIYKINALEVSNTFSYQAAIEGPLHLCFKEIERIVKEGETDRFLTELSKEIERKLLETQAPVVAEALLLIEQSRQMIAKNANQRLTLENLVLTIRDLS